MPWVEPPMNLARVAAGCASAKRVRCGADATRRDGTWRFLGGCREVFPNETGMPVHIADNPLSSVAIGSGKCLEEFEVLQRVLVSPSRR